MPTRRTLRGALTLCLSLSLTACASVGTAPSPWIECQHPLIDPTSNEGLSDAVEAYASALDLCNALNNPKE